MRSMPIEHVLVAPIFERRDQVRRFLGVDTHHCVGNNEGLVLVSGRAVSSCAEDDYGSEIGPTFVLLHVVAAKFI